MKAMRIVEPHFKQQSGSASYTYLISAARPLRASRAVGDRAGIPGPAAAAGRRWALWPRVLLEHHAAVSPAGE
jgi:hypothetical protein